MIKVKEPAGGFRRFGAFILDSVILWLNSVVVLTLLFVYKSLTSGVSIDVMQLGRGSNFLLWFVSFLYFVFFEQSEWQATPGKKLFDLKVEGVFGGRLSLWRAILRNLLFNVIYIPIWVFYIKHASSIANDVNELIQVLSSDNKLLLLVGGSTVLFQLIWFVPIFFTKKKTSTYDLLSRTRVVGQKR